MSFGRVTTALLQEPEGDIIMANVLTEGVASRSDWWVSAEVKIIPAFLAYTCDQCELVLSGPNAYCVES